jgi:hypothetical protein
MNINEAFGRTPFFCFARRWGLSLFHGSAEAVQQYLKSQQASLQLHIWEQELLAYQDEEISILIRNLAAQFKINQTAVSGPLLQVIRIGRQEYWVALQIIGDSQVKGISGGTGERFTAPEFIISRAYHKLRESWGLLDSQFRGGHWLELGCAPGGAVQFLLAQGNRVTGVDPGPMDQRIFEDLSGPKRLESSVEKNPPSFKFIHLPTQEVTKKMLFETYANVDWLAVDMNLSVKQSLTYAERVIMDFPSIKGIIYTFKISHPVMIDQVPWIQRKLYDLGFPYQMSFQWPHHRKEFLQVALRKKNFTTILPNDLSAV